MPKYRKTAFELKDQILHLKQTLNLSLRFFIDVDTMAIYYILPPLSLTPLRNWAIGIVRLVHAFSAVIVPKVANLEPNSYQAIDPAHKRISKRLLKPLPILIFFGKMKHSNSSLASLLIYMCLEKQRHSLLPLRG